MRHAIASPATRRWASELAGITARQQALAHAIEQAPDDLRGHSETLDFLLQQTRLFNEALAGSVCDRPLDPDGQLSLRLEGAAEHLVRLFRAAIQARRAAKKDPATSRMVGLDEAYNRHITLLADLHNAVEDLRDTAETLDSLTAPVGSRAYTCVDELFEDLEVS